MGRLPTLKTALGWQPSAWWLLGLAAVAVAGWVLSLGVLLGVAALSPDPCFGDWDITCSTPSARWFNWIYALGLSGMLMSHLLFQALMIAGAVTAVVAASRRIRRPPSSQPDSHRPSAQRLTLFEILAIVMGLVVLFSVVNVGLTIIAVVKVAGAVIAVVAASRWIRRSQSSQPASHRPLAPTAH
jgi:hypothetical protein